MISRIGGADGAGAQAGAMGMNPASDPVSKDLLRQIDDAKKKLQELSSNEDLSAEEKMKKRQELQKHISDLNSQLRQHQMEMRREAAENAKKQKSQDSGQENPARTEKKSEEAKGKKGSGLSEKRMQAMISADGSMKQAKVSGSAAHRMEGKAGVLEAEIKLDSARGGSTQAKEAELAEVKEKAANAVSFQMDTLSKANQTANEAAKTDQEAKKTPENEKKALAGSEPDDLKEEQEEASKHEAQKEEENGFVRYKPVDVRL